MRTQCNTSRKPCKARDNAQVVFDFADVATPIVVDQQADYLTTDAGILALRQVDERFGLTDAFVGKLTDDRYRPWVVHSIHRLIREKVYVYAAGYEDANDHTLLRSDPLIKAVVGPIARKSTNPKKQDGLASEATLSRLLYGRKIRGFDEACHSHVEGFLKVLGGARPSVLTLDIDGFGIETHGQQTFAFYNGHLGHDCYYPLHVSIAEYGFVVGALLRPGNAGAAAMALDLLKPIVEALKKALPDTKLRLRADAGFASPEIYAFAERSKMEYFVRLRMNNVLAEEFEWLLPELPPEDFCRREEWLSDTTYQAGTWNRPRRVALKQVWNDKTYGYERYALITNSTKQPDKLWSIYHHRGQEEQRIGELVNDLRVKMSCCVQPANSMKLHLMILAHNLHAAIRMLLPKTHPYKRSSIGRLIRDLVRCAGLVKQSARRLLVRLSRAAPNTEHLMDLLARLKSGRVRACPLWVSG